LTETSYIEGTSDKFDSKVRESDQKKKQRKLVERSRKTDRKARYELRQPSWVLDGLGMAKMAQNACVLRSIKRI